MNKNKVILSFVTLIVSIIFVLLSVIKDSPTEAKPTETVTLETQETVDEPKQMTLTDVSYKTLPEYESDAFVYVNDNNPLFTDEEISFYTNNATDGYFNVDGFKRATGACMVISPDTLSTEDRADISDLYPTGWNQTQYEGVVEGDWIYNRCHLIAHCLGGPDDIKNLITGTRYLNIEGMWQMEETVLNYVREQNGRVLYRVTPIYKESELVARGVLMEAYSLDDDGCRFCVYCYNVQPYVMIHYQTGQTSLIEE